MPVVWGLLGHRWGDNQQVIAVAEALGWPFLLKQLHYGRASRIPNFLRRTHPLGIRIDPTTPLEPPWPDLVIAVGYRSVPLALHLRAASGGRCRLVQLGRPRAPLSWFDLILTTPQYQLPAASNVVVLPLPFNRGPGTAAPSLLAELAALPRPHVVALVGGPTKELTFGATEAHSLVCDLSRHHARCGGSLLVTTSPRTTSEVSTILEHELPAPHRLHRWAPDTPNPYPTFLATADQIVVTSDSVSMLADACRSGAPLRRFDLPRRGRWRDASAVTVPTSRRHRVILALGVAAAPRRYDAVHLALQAHGLLDDGADRGALLDDATRRHRKAIIAAWEEQALTRVRALVADP